MLFTKHFQDLIRSSHPPSWQKVDLDAANPRTVFTEGSCWKSVGEWKESVQGRFMIKLSRRQTTNDGQRDGGWEYHFICLFVHIYVSMKIAIVSWDDNFSANWINGIVQGRLSAMMAGWCCWIVFSIQRITFYVRPLTGVSASLPYLILLLPLHRPTLIIQSAAPWRITRHWMK